MRFEYDPGADALYVWLGEGRVERTVELAEGAYADLDAEDRPVGLEFVALAAFRDVLERRGTLVVPERAPGPGSFLRARPHLLLQRHRGLLEPVALYQGHRLP